MYIIRILYMDVKILDYFSKQKEVRQQIIWETMW